MTCITAYFDTEIPSRHDRGLLCWLQGHPGTPPLPSLPCPEDMPGSPSTQDEGKSLLGVPENPLCWDMRAAARCLCVSLPPSCCFLCQPDPA
jgi:hypothetical protein